MRQKYKSMANAVFLLLWSIRLDLKLINGWFWSSVSLRLCLQLSVMKYLGYLRDSLTRTVSACRSISLAGKNYFYNDRFGAGSVQRVFAESLPLKDYVSPGAVVVDVGANLGQFNLFCDLVLKAARIISIEPDPASFSLLQKNAVVASDCVEALVDDELCMRRLYLAADSQLNSVFCSESGQKQPFLEMQTSRLEEILRALEVDRIDLLKVDCEGNDLAVLRSAGKYLDKTGVIYVEMNTTRESSGNIFVTGSYLESRGFRLKKLVVADSGDLSTIDGIFVRSASNNDDPARSSK